MVVLSCKLGKAAFFCYFARNDMILLSLIKKEILILQPNWCKTKTFCTMHIVRWLCYLANLAKSHECAISHVAQSYSNVLFGVILEKELSVPNLRKSILFCGLVRGENYMFCLIESLTLA